MRLVRRSATDGVSWEGERAGGERRPLKVQLEVPDLNADSLHVIKNSLS